MFSSCKDATIFAKMFKITAQKYLNREDVLHVKGCPVSVAEQALLLVYLGGLDNPYFDPDNMFSFTSCYLSWRSRTAIKRLFGKKYNKPGPSPRGIARPVQNIPQ